MAPFGSVKATRSPAAKTSGCPGRLRSGSTSIRPLRSSGTPAKVRVTSLASTPAAQMMISDVMRSWGICTKPGPTSLTGESRCTWTPMLVRRSRVYSGRLPGNMGSSFGPASTRCTLAQEGSMRRKSFLSTLRDNSANDPAISTPVGPPPTTTMVKSRSVSAASAADSARSKANKTSRRIRMASFKLLSPWVCSSHSGCPK